MLNKVKLVLVCFLIMLSVPLLAMSGGGHRPHDPGPHDPGTHVGGECDSDNQCGEGKVCKESLCVEDNSQEPTDPVDPTQEPADPTEPTKDPESDPIPAGVACANVPSLEHFVLVESTCSSNEIAMTFAPAGMPYCLLHVKLQHGNGQNMLSAWCTGNEGLCKAVGNGQTCNGVDYTGTNAWCYKPE